MRIKEKIENIDYNDTKLFFKKRAEKFQESNPYSVTMYQDNNEEIVSKTDTFSDISNGLDIPINIID